MSNTDPLDPRAQVTPGRGRPNPGAFGGGTRRLNNNVLWIGGVAVLIVLLLVGQGFLRKLSHKPPPASAGVGTGKDGEDATAQANKLIASAGPQPGATTPGVGPAPAALPSETGATSGPPPPASRRQAFPFESYFEELYAHFAQPGVWAAYPEAPGVLAELRARGFKLGVISNFDGRLRTVLRGLDLASCFASVTISSEVGVDKPDPKIFQHALKALQVSAAQTVHVGDDPQVRLGRKRGRPTGVRTTPAGKLAPLPERVAGSGPLEADETCKRSGNVLKDVSAKCGLIAQWFRAIAF